MRTNVINLLKRVPEHDCLTFFMLHMNETKCKLIGAFLSLFRAAQNEIKTNAFRMGAFLRRKPNPNPNLNRNPNRNRNPIQNALVYILFCVARKKSENRALGHDP